jgi:hypothetical protein
MQDAPSQLIDIRWHVGGCEGTGFCFLLELVTNLRHYNMVIQLISNRYINLEDLRSLLGTKFGGDSFSILVAHRIRAIHKVRS